MHVVAFHARYRTLGGEDRSFEQDVRLFRSLGWDVSAIEVKNSDFRLSDVARLRFLESRDLNSLVSKTKIDLVYLNNLWPSVGPGVGRVAISRGIPVLQSVRNYRLACVAATLRREGLDCVKCVDKKSRRSGVALGCYEGSRAKSLAVAGAAAYNESLSRRHGSQWAYAPTSRSVADQLIAFGLPSEQMYIRNNYLFDTPNAVLSPGKGAIYVGRLSTEKGIGWLLDLWKSDARLPKLSIFGDGPLVEQARQLELQDSRVSVQHTVDHDRVLSELSGSAVCLVPSDWEEPFGRSAMESLAVGTPVLSSNRGALPGVVGQAGMSLALDRGAWTQEILNITSLAAQDTLRVVARRRFLEMFSRDSAARALRSILKDLGLPGEDLAK